MEMLSNIEEFLNTMPNLVAEKSSFTSTFHFEEDQALQVQTNHLPYHNFETTSLNLDIIPSKQKSIRSTFYIYHNKLCYAMVY